MNQVPPLRLTPDGAQLLANRELLRLSKELSEVYASKECMLAKPFRHFVYIMRWVMLKGARLGNIGEPFGILGVEAVVMLALAMNWYREISE